MRYVQAFCFALTSDQQIYGLPVNENDIEMRSWVSLLITESKILEKQKNIKV